MSEYSEFEEVLSRYFEGTASADDLVGLDVALRTDEHLADHASRWCLMHRQVAELMTEDALHEMMDRFVQGAPGPPKRMFSSGGAASIASDPLAPGHGRRLRGLWLLAAAASIALLGIGMWGRLGKPPAIAEATAVAVPAVGESLLTAAAPVGDEIIATLTRLVDVAWAEDAQPLHPGDHLAQGSRVMLASGMAKVTFECGAEIVLEGPCDFVIQSQMLGFLNSGKLTADVPRRAFGFAILSPGVDFVDLGTSFGVSVDDHSTELHVFEGEVLCSQSAATRGSNEAIHVHANRALEFAPSGGDPNDIAMNTEGFSDLIAMRRPHSVDAPRIVPEDLALWLAADAAVATDAAGRVVSWQDIVYGDNQSAEDAIQGDAEARPRLTAKAVNGRPAICFDGESDFLLTTPLETTDDQTVVMVCQFSPRAYGAKRRWGGQIINYDGPPSRYLSNLLEPGVLQIGEPLLENQFRPTLVSAQVFAGFIGSATVEAGRVDGAEVGADTPIVLSYIYDYSHRRAELSINGRSQGETRAFAPQGITSRKIIGRHAWMQNFFHGDLAELLIYNKALSAEELAATSAYLAGKYGIELESGH